MTNNVVGPSEEAGIICKTDNGLYKIIIIFYKESTCIFTLSRSIYISNKHFLLPIKIEICVVS